MRRTRLLLPALAAAAALAPAAPADARKDIAYAVEYEGQGDYTYNEREDHPGGWSERDTVVSFLFRGHISDGVVFRDGDVFDHSADDLGESFAAGTYTLRGQESGGPVQTTVCPSDDDARAHGWMRFADALGDLAALDPDAHLYLRPFDLFDVSFTCDADSHAGVSLVDWTNVSGETELLEPGKHTFDILFDLPHEVFGMGYIEQLIPVKVVEGAACPGHVAEVTKECRLTWSGKVTLRKLWEKDVPAGPAPSGSAPAGTGAAPAPAPKPAPAPAAAPADDDWLVPLVRKSSAKLTPSARSASVQVSCPAGCAGTATVLPSGGAARAAAARPLATARFRVAAGGTRRITVPLGTRARRSLRRSRRATLELSFTAPKRSVQRFAIRLPRTR